MAWFFSSCKQEECLLLMFPMDSNSLRTGQTDRKYLQGGWRARNLYREEATKADLIDLMT